MIAVAAFGAISAGAAIATAVGVTAFLGMSMATWAAIGAVGMLVSGLAMAASMPKPKTPESAGQQLNMKLSGNDALPVAYGRSATGGTIYHRQTYNQSNKTLAMLVALSVGGSIAGIETVRANDYGLTLSGGFGSKQTVIAAIGDTDSKSKMFKDNSLSFYHKLGQTPEPQTPSEYSGQPIQAGKHSGIATAMVQAEYKQENFPQGLPKFQWIVQGQRVYDPRKDSTYPGGSGSHRINNPDTWTYSENPQLCALNWTLGRFQNGKKVFGIGASPEQIDIPAFVAGANVSDALGWKVGGVVQTTDEKFSVLGSLLQAGGSIPIARGAQISCLTYSVKTSIYNIGINDVVGGVSVLNTAPYRDRKNRITPTYREESQFWNMVPGEAVSSTVYVAEDGGEERSAEITLPLVQNAAQAHQLATYDLVNTREFLQFEITAKPKLLGVRVGDCVTVTLPDISVNNQKCMVVSRDFDPTTWQVKLVLRSETDAKHAFALGQSQVAPPSPSLTTFDPSNPDAPFAGSWEITATEHISTGQFDITPEPAEGEPPVPAEDRIYETRIIGRNPALVITGAVTDPTVQKVIVDVRPTPNLDELFPNGLPAEGALAAFLEDYGWTFAAEGPRTADTFNIQTVSAQTSYEASVSYETVLGVRSRRLIIGPATTSDQVVGGVRDGGVDWNANTVVNRPPVIDPNHPDYLDAGSLRWRDETLGDALSDIANAQVLTSNAIADLNELVANVADTSGLTDALNELETRVDDLVANQDSTLANAIADIDGRLDTAESLVTTATNRVNGVWAIVGETAGEGLRSSVVNLTTSVGDVTTRFNGVEQVVNATGVNALTRQSDLTDLETSIDGTYARSTTVSALEGRITTSEGQVSGLITRVDDVETDVAGRATISSVNTLGGTVSNLNTTVSGHSTRLDQVELDVDGRATVSSVTNLTNRVTGTEGNITATNGRLDTVETDLAGKASSTSVTNLQSEVTGARNGSANLSAQLGTMRQTVTDGLAGKASVTSVDNLTSRVGTAETNITGTNTRIDSVETELDGKASSTSVANLTSEVTGARNGSASLSAQLGTMRQTVTDGLAGKASVTDVSNLTSRVGTAETNITGTNTRIDNVVTDLAGKASSSSVTTLSNEITGARNGSANLNAQLTTMRQTVTDGLAGKASATDVSNLTTRVGNTEGTVSSHAGRLTTVESDVAGKASASSVSTLSSEVVDARNGGTTLKSRIDGLQTTLTDAINLKASNSSFLTLQSEINDARAGRPNLRSTIDFLYTTTVDGLAGKASAQSVSDLSVSVNGFDSRITSAANVAAQANGRASAVQGVVLDVNGLISGYSSVNNGQTSSFNVNSNVFNMLTPGNPGDRIEMSGVTGIKMFKNGVKRIHLGFV
jgi:hypothetical protein